MTTLEPYEAFFKADDLHQDFYNSNPEYPYFEAVISPKLQKLREKYADRLKVA